MIASYYGMLLSVEFWYHVMASLLENFVVVENNFDTA